MFTMTIWAYLLEEFLIGSKLREKKGFDIANLVQLPYMEFKAQDHGWECVSCLKIGVESGKKCQNLLLALLALILIHYTCMFLCVKSCPLQQNKVQFFFACEFGICTKLVVHKWTAPYPNFNAWHTFSAIVLGFVAPYMAAAPNWQCQNPFSPSILTQLKIPPEDMLIWSMWTFLQEEINSGFLLRVGKSLHKVSGT